MPADSSSVTPPSPSVGKLARWLPLAAVFVAMAVFFSTGSDSGRQEWERQAAQGLKLGCAIAALIFLALFATVRWWGRRAAGKSAGAGEGTAVAPLRSSGARWFWALLVAAVVLGAAVRWRFAHGSLWWDEIWNVRETTVGEFRPDAKKPGEQKFRAATFKRALWYYNKPANHPIVSLLSRSCHLAWSRMTGAAEGRFNAFVLRLPVFLAGLGGIALCGIVLRLWGFSVAGVAAAFVLALHPWALRYGVDARAYGMLMLLVPMGMYFLTKLAVQPFRERWIWLLGLTQFLLMWCHLMSLYICLAFFVAAWILLRRSLAPAEGKENALAFRIAVQKLVAANAVAAALLAICMLPCLAQAAEWGSRNQDANTLTFSYFLQTLSQAAFGVEPSWAAGENVSGLVSLAGIAGGRLWLGWTLAAIVFALAGAGLWRLRRTHSPGGVILLCLFGCCAAYLAAIAASGFYFYHRFIIGMAGPVAILAAVGASGSAVAANGKSRRLPVILGAGALVLAFAGVSFPQIMLFQRRSYTPWKEASDALAAELRRDPKVRVVGFGHGGEALHSYLPATIMAREPSPTELLRMGADADAAGTQLLICYAYPELHARNLPESVAVLGDPAKFRRVWKGSGIEPEFTVSILRWHGGVAPVKPPAIVPAPDAPPNPAQSQPKS